jgi:hydrogenase/urease accessory protein HupE
MKAINIVMGLATAIILGALINLGIKAFYPEPASPTYVNYSATAAVVPCASNDATCIQTNKQADLQQQTAQAQFNQQEQAYEDAMKVYNRNLFIIANVIGILMFALGFWLVFGNLVVAARGVPIGIMLAGLWSIVYGYGRGWGSVNDQLKFFIGLVIAALIIGGSVWLMERYQKRKIV